LVSAFSELIETILGTAGPDMNLVFIFLNCWVVGFIFFGAFIACLNFP